MINFLICLNSLRGCAILCICSKNFRKLQKVSKSFRKLQTFEKDIYSHTYIITSNGLPQTLQAIVFVVLQKEEVRQPVCSTIKLLKQCKFQLILIFNQDSNQSSSFLYSSNSSLGSLSLSLLSNDHFQIMIWNQFDLDHFI